MDYSKREVEDDIKFGTTEFVPNINSRTALEKTIDFDVIRLLPDLNVIKLGGQSIIDRGRTVVFPLLDEIRRLKSEFQLLIACGGGTRARHAFSIALNVGAPIGIVASLGLYVPRQNARMIAWCLAKDGGVFVPDPHHDFEIVQLYTKIGCVPVTIAMPPNSYWEKPRAKGRIPANRTDSGNFLLAEFFGARTCIYIKDEKGLFTADPKKDKSAKFIPKIHAAELMEMSLDDLIIERIVLENMLNAKHVKEIRVINGLEPENLEKALNKEHVGTIIYAD